MQSARVGKILEHIKFIFDALPPPQDQPPSFHPVPAGAQDERSDAAVSDGGRCRRGAEREARAEGCEDRGAASLKEEHGAALTAEESGLSQGPQGSRQEAHRRED